MSRARSVFGPRPVEDVLQGRLKVRIPFNCPVASDTPLASSEKRGGGSRHLGARGKNPLEAF